MRCDSWASLFARTFANPCLGQEPKVRVTTIGHHHQTSVPPFFLVLVENFVLFCFVDFVTLVDANPKKTRIIGEKD
jgi:hypothetical protein